MMDDLKKMLRPAFFIRLLLVGQFFSVLSVAIGIWPSWVLWISGGFLAIFIVAAPALDSLVLLVASAPFYTAVPSGPFDSLSMWRPLFVLFFLSFAVRNFWNNRHAPSGGNKTLLARFGFEVHFPWDRALLIFAVVAAVVTIIFAPFRLEGLKQLLFFANIYMLYAVASSVIRTGSDISRVLQYGLWSLGVIVAAGFVQLIATFFTSLDIFWVYWASFVSRLYYGQEFASVSLYSNSWFSYTSGRELRMFSILPDSQSFGYLCVFMIGWATALLLYRIPKTKTILRSAVAAASLGIVLSGTRAVWVGVLVPAAAAIASYWKGFFRPQAKIMLMAYAVIFLLFAASPLISSGIRLIRMGGAGGNFLDRAQSIYDLGESSNAGRIAMWGQSIRYGLSHPWGTGLNNFLVSLAGSSGNYESLAESVNERYNLPQKYVSAHSLYLQVFVELGLAGLAAACWFWWKFFKSSAFFIWQRRKAPASAEVFMVFQAMLIFAWLLSSAVFDITLLNDRVLMFFFITLALSGAALRAVPPAAKEKEAA